MTKRILDVLSRAVHHQYTGTIVSIVSLAVAYLSRGDVDGGDADEVSSAVLALARILVPRPRQE